MSTCTPHHEHHRRSRHQQQQRRRGGGGGEWENWIPVGPNVLLSFSSKTWLRRRRYAATYVVKVQSHTQVYLYMVVGPDYTGWMMMMANEENSKQKPQKPLLLDFKLAVAKYRVLLLSNGRQVQVWVDSAKVIHLFALMMTHSITMLHSHCLLWGISRSLEKWINHNYLIHHLLHYKHSWITI